MRDRLTRDQINEIMDEMGRAAQANGLTQEALADILEND